MRKMGPMRKCVVKTEEQVELCALKNWQCQRRRSLGACRAVAASPRMSQKREHHFRDTLFCVVPPGIVIHFQVAEYHTF